MCIKAYDVNIINELIRLAISNKISGKVTHGAAIAYKGKILYKCTNCYKKTCPLTPQDLDTGYVTKHAEIGVLNWLKNSRIKDKKGLTIYITGLSKAHEPTFIKNSKPCYRCEKVIKESEVTRIIYSECKSNEFKLIEQNICL
jgi:hypothetical protein